MDSLHKIQIFPVIANHHHHSKKLHLLVANPKGVHHQNHPVLLGDFEPLFLELSVEKGNIKCKMQNYVSDKCFIKNVSDYSCEEVTHVRYNISF